MIWSNVYMSIYCFVAMCTLFVTMRSKHATCRHLGVACIIIIFANVAASREIGLFYRLIELFDSRISITSSILSNVLVLIYCYTKHRTA